jgi:hypothetical protein
MQLSPIEMYGIIGFGVVLWSAMVFEVLLGLRVIKIKGRAHWRVHRAIAILLVVVAPVHGVVALGHFLYGWF